MIGPHQVDLRKDGAPVKVGCKILYVRNRIPVRDSDSVQCSVVTTWSPVTGGFFGHHVEW